MKPSLVLGAGIAAALLAWFAGAELHWPARALMSFLVGVMPALSVIQAGVATQLTELPSRLKLYTSTTLGLWVLAFVTAIAATESGFNPRLLGVVEIPWPSFLIWTTASIAGVAALVLAFKAIGTKETPLLAHMIPQRASEKLVFVGVSATAGICEELVFRGFLIAALQVATGSLPLATVLSAGAFGIAHAHQDATGALRATLLALVLSAPLIVTGSLYPGIAAHALVDLAGGLWLAKWLIKSE
ncbi:MAG TPA: type II CAAX endopeptidase family protein [Longimicrobiales bacterium]